jgi:DNA modification methylase
LIKFLEGDVIDCLKSLPDESVHCCVTSPPYWGLRDYGIDGQLGLEETPDEYVANMVEVFREVKRVLRSDGTLWLNLGDSYASSAKESGGHNPKQDSNRGSRTGLKPKDLVGIPWRVALALQTDGWWLRSDIIWSKTNPMPESVTDRPTCAHEYVFLLTKTIGWQPTCSCDTGEVIPCTTLDPFGGSGTVAKVSRDFGRDSIYIDLNSEYVQMAMNRVGKSLFNEIYHEVC